MKLRVLFTWFLILSLGVGCGHKELENKVSDNKLLSTHAPSLLFPPIDGGKIKEADYSGPFPQVTERKGISPNHRKYDFISSFSDMTGIDTGIADHKTSVAAGFAVLLAGALVYGVGKKADVSLTELLNLLRAVKVSPALAQNLNRDVLRKTLTFFEERGVSRQASTSVARLLINTKPGLKTWLQRMAGRGMVRVPQFLARAARFAGGALTVVGIAEMVLEPEVMGDGEVTPYEKFEYLKKSIEQLEKARQSDKEHLVDQTIEILGIATNNLMFEYNERFNELELVKEHETEFNKAEVEKAVLDFETWEKKQAQHIKYFQTARESLKDIAMIEALDINEADDILAETMEELQKIVLENSETLPQ